MSSPAEYAEYYLFVKKALVLFLCSTFNAFFPPYAPPPAQYTGLNSTAYYSNYSLYPKSPNVNYMLRQKNMIDDTQMSPSPDYIRTLRTSQNYHKCPRTQIEYVDVTEFIVHEGPTYTEYVNVTVEVVRNVTQYEFLCEPWPIFVEMPITRNVTVEVVRNVTQYEFLCEPWPIFVEMPITRNVTVEVVRNVTQYVNVTQIEYVNNTDACLGHLFEVFVETVWKHTHIIGRIVYGIVAGIISIVVRHALKLGCTVPNRWHREVFLPGFSAFVTYMGGVCIECQWKSFMTFAADLVASYAPLCYVGALLFLCALVFVFYRTVISFQKKAKQQEVDKQLQKLSPVLQLLINAHSEWSPGKAALERLLEETTDVRENPVLTGFLKYMNTIQWSQDMEESIKPLVEFMQNCDKLYNSMASASSASSALYRFLWIKFADCFSVKREHTVPDGVPVVQLADFKNVKTKLRNTAQALATEINEKKVKAAGNTENNAQLGAQVRGDTQRSALVQPAAPASAPGGAPAGAQRGAQI
jgi:hypothetical protein